MNKAKYIFITTQYMENYGTDEVPYMKFKGGSNYQVGPLNPDATENEVATMLAQVRPIITTSLIESGGGCEEYILESKVIEGSDWSGIIEDYETVTELQYMRGEWTAMKTTDNRDDAMWMRREILEKTESWTCGPHQERNNYKVEFLMETGENLEGQAELTEWLITKEAEGNFKQGDIVTPSAGPHKGEKHTIIHNNEDGTYNIEPMSSQNKYKHGAVKAKESQLTLAEEAPKEKMITLKDIDNGGKKDVKLNSQNG